MGVDPRKADQMVRGVVTLPHGTGKTVSVLALVTPWVKKEAQVRFLNNWPDNFLRFDSLIQSASPSKELQKPHLNQLEMLENAAFSIRSLHIPQLPITSKLAFSFFEGLSCPKENKEKETMQKIRNGFIVIQIYKLKRRPTYIMRPKTGAYTKLLSKLEEKGWSAEIIG